MVRGGIREPSPKWRRYLYWIDARDPGAGCKRLYEEVRWSIMKPDSARTRESMVRTGDLPRGCIPLSSGGATLLMRL